MAISLFLQIFYFGEYLFKLLPTRETRARNPRDRMGVRDGFSRTLYLKLLSISLSQFDVNEDVAGKCMYRKIIQGQYEMRKYVRLRALVFLKLRERACEFT